MSHTCRSMVQYKWVKKKTWKQIFCILILYFKGSFNQSALFVQPDFVLKRQQVNCLGKVLCTQSILVCPCVNKNNNEELSLFKTMASNSDQLLSSTCSISKRYPAKTVILCLHTKSYIKLRIYIFVVKGLPIYIFFGRKFKQDS